MRSPHAQIATQRLGGLGAERTRPTPPTLAQHLGDAQLQVDVVHGEPGQFAGSHSGVDEHADDGQVAAVLEGVPATRRQQRQQLLDREDRDRLLGNRGRSHAFHRRALDLAVVDEPDEELLQAAVVLGDRGRAHLGRLPSAPDDLIGELGKVQLDVLTPDGTSGRRQFLSVEETNEARRTPT